MTFVGLPERIEELAVTRGDGVAISCGADDVTYRELHRKVAAIAAALRNPLGVRAGDRVGWIGLNDPAQIAALAALMRIGAIMVPLNYRLAPAELTKTLSDAGAELLIADDSFASMASTLGVRSIHRDSLWSCEAVDSTTAASRTDPTAAALVVYTSGTTGRPKGAIHTNAMLCANALASDAFHRFRDDDIVLSALPMFHVGGLCIQTIPALYHGARLIVQQRFDAREWLEAVARERVTISLMVPATMRAAQEHAQWATTDLSSLRMLGAGSSTIPASLIARCHARNVPVCQVYGATETGPVSIVLDVSDAFAHVGAAGKPALGVSIRLVDEDGNDVDDECIGEVLVSGPNVVAGYWNDRGSANPSFRDGWFHSGDLAVRDRDGLYTIVGRARDLIISGGENIHPAEIENALIEIDGIVDAAVVGVPDPRWGQVPVAAVVTRPNDASGEAPDESTIRAALDSKLARFKHPKRIVFRATLPRNALGKVQKQALIDEIAQS